VRGGGIDLLDVSSGRVRLSLHDLAGQNAAVAFAAGNTLATGDSDGSIRVWDTAAGNERLVLEEGRGYLFLLRSHRVPSPGLDPQLAPGGPSFAAARKNGAAFVVQIWKDRKLLREQDLVVPVDRPLRLLAQRLGDRVLFQVNNAPPLEFQDLFAHGAAAGGCFGLDWPEGVPRRRVSAARRPPATRPSLLEEGDDSRVGGELLAALGRYEEQARRAGPREPAGQEARCKQALCLAALG